MDRRDLVKKIIEKTSASKENLMILALCADNEVLYTYDKLYNEENVYKDDSKWCDGHPNEDWGVTFYDDGEHPYLYKHHYRCCKCKKITQIG